MQSKATTVQSYLASLPADRREAIAAVRALIRKNIDEGFEEGMQYGMIGYYVPHSAYPAGYHCDPNQPLPYACLASQKNHMSLYIMSAYTDEAHAKWFHRAWAKTGKKLDMGKSCVRFKKLDDLALDVIGENFRRLPMKKFIKCYEDALKLMKREPAKAKPAAKKKPAVKKSIKKKK